MANLKNITELPVAESADGLNLIVNDNGVAKQIAASEVGLSMHGAKVGQVVKISAVDDNGRPTAWESANLPIKLSDFENDLFYVGKEVYTKTITLADCTVTDFGGYECVFPFPEGADLTEATAELHVVTKGKSHTFTNSALTVLPGRIWSMQFSWPDGDMVWYCELMYGAYNPETGGYIKDGKGHFIIVATDNDGEPYHIDIDEMTFRFTKLESKRLPATAVGGGEFVVGFADLLDNDGHGGANTINVELFNAVKSFCNRSCPAPTVFINNWSSNLALAVFYSDMNDSAAELVAFPAGDKFVLHVYKSVEAYEEGHITDFS